MRSLAPLLACFLCACVSPQARASAHHDPELANRKPGPSQRCIEAHEGAEFRLADNDRHVLLYGSGTTIWANHLRGLCGFSKDDELISDPWNGRYCSGQLIRSVDISRAEGPSCILGDFTPYSQSEPR